jgi:hypothetical protein
MPRSLSCQLVSVMHMYVPCFFVLSFLYTNESAREGAGLEDRSTHRQQLYARVHTHTHTESAVYSTSCFLHFYMVYSPNSILDFTTTISASPWRCSARSHTQSAHTSASCASAVEARVSPCLYTDHIYSLLCHSLHTHTPGASPYSYTPTHSHLRVIPMHWAFGPTIEPTRGVCLSAVTGCLNKRGTLPPTICAAEVLWDVQLGGTRVPTWAF